MPNEEKTAAPPEATHAVCPYCGADPAIFNILTNVTGGTPMGDLTIATIFCADTACRKMFNVQVVAITPVKKGIVSGAGAGVLRM